MAGESEGKGKNSWVGKKRFQQKKQRDKKITTRILIKRIYRTQFSHHLILRSLLSSKSPYSSQLPHINTEHDVTESENDRMLGVGRDLCGSPSPTFTPKKGHLQQAAENHVQAGLEYLQRRRLHNLPGHPVPVLRHPQREEVLPHVQTELPVLQCVPIAPCPVAGHH